MGAKSWMVVYADRPPREVLASRPPLDREASANLARQLFPRAKLRPAADVTLADTAPRGGAIHIGQYPGVAIVAAREFTGDYPSRIAPRFLEHPAGSITLHYMHSVVDAFAYGLWRDGKLVRSLGVEPDKGVYENFGKPLPFEEPYFAGKYPAVDSEEDADSYPLPFHPLDLGAVALACLFGYQLEGVRDEEMKYVSFEAESIALLRFERASWWQFW